MLAKILEIWTGILTWFSSSMTSITSLFYTESGLTFLGCLCVVGVGISLVMLIINVVKDFLQLRA